MTLAAIPSPSVKEWFIPLPFVDWTIPIRAYSLAIVAGIFLAVWITGRRLRSRGAPPGLAVDVAIWAVPFGILGARLYHVITDYQLYFAPGQDPLGALRIYEGGLGIPGAILGGALGAWIACRRAGFPLTVFADALAVGLPVAQAVGRIGNWFNQELYGRPTDLPWGLEIDFGKRETGYEDFVTFHPTFLYEALWNLGGAGLIWWLDKRFKFGKGRAFALYVIMYGVGRFWVEGLRIDEAHAFLGLRLNMWTAAVAVLGGLVYFLLVRGPREQLGYDPSGAVRLDPSDEAVGEAAGEGDAEGDPADADEKARGGDGDDEEPDGADAAAPGGAGSPSGR
ncbi:MAG: prolipoprotein diacylglyceryl transferase [Micromonosporaceae bacterium]|nr:prolipoprotein diacylglyceryl transferase [Micromonosporaceae bacterium]